VTCCCLVLCLQVTNLKHQTCLDRISNLQHLLHLTPGEASQLVLRLPQLLLYTPGKLAGLVNGISEVLGGLDKAKALALKEPQVSHIVWCLLETCLIAAEALLHSHRCCINQCKTIACHPHTAHCCNLLACSRCYACAGDSSTLCHCSRTVVACAPASSLRAMAA